MMLWEQEQHFHEEGDSTWKYPEKISYPSSFSSMLRDSFGALITTFIDFWDAELEVVEVELVVWARSYRLPEFVSTPL